MFPVDPLWFYIAVPCIVVSILILIRIKQEKMNKPVESPFTEKGDEEEVHSSEKEASTEGLGGVKETRTLPEISEDTMSPDSLQCPHYLGYLYLKKDPDIVYIPNECYNCRKLLQCLYSPNVIEKVYGK